MSSHELIGYKIARLLIYVFYLHVIEIILIFGKCSIVDIFIVAMYRPNLQLQDHASSNGQL